MEKQIRFHTNADLPVCYRSEPGGQFLYVLPDAVTAYTDAAAAAEARAATCRQPAGGRSLCFCARDCGTA